VGAERLDLDRLRYSNSGRLPTATRRQRQRQARQKRRGNKPAAQGSHTIGWTHHPH